MVAAEKQMIAIKAAIRVLLNDERFSNIKTIKELYELVEDAQKSY